ncbi:MAG: type II toxin-antitoxin system VapC family toxin [Alphaproteobacteria bacterium]
MIILDTNVLSEFMRPRPHEAVMRWIEDFFPRDLYTTAITVAEIQRGICLLPDGHRRRLLADAARDVFELYMQDRILPFDSHAAEAFAEIAARQRNRAQSLKAFDAQIAGIARSNAAKLATRNVRDFQDCGVRVLNPWDT